MCIRDRLDNVLETTASFLATGLNPNKSIIFNQSSVSGHAELAWILNCVSRIGWLNRMTQFKDKAGSDKEKASVGLYIYPNLMAADILLYKATHVPVGADQKQHLELSRDIAQKFNNDFNCQNFFPLPEPLIPKKISRIMSLRDGTKKMSKSEESSYSRINLKDTADEISKKIKKAKSDSEPIPDNIKSLEKKPEALNLLTIYSELTQNNLEKVNTDSFLSNISYKNINQSNMNEANSKSMFLSFGINPFLLGINIDQTDSSGLVEFESDNISFFGKYFLNNSAYLSLLGKAPT